MTIDVSLIPQNRVENLISKLTEIENNIGNIGTDITNNVVHKTGNETISGEKTFTSYTHFTSSEPKLVFKSSVMDITQSGWTAGRNSIAWCEDKNGYESGGIYNNISNDDKVVTSLYAISRKSGKQQSSFIRVGVDGLGNAFTEAPTPSSSDSSSKIATTAWVNNLDNSVVHKAGNETITGTKTYNIDGYDIYKSTVMDITNKPTEAHSIGTNYSDKNGYVHGQIFLRTETNGRVEQSISCLNHSNTSWAQFSIGFDSNDNIFADLNGNLIKGFVKETWKSGTSWYRIWSDGWIEQGGQTPKTLDAVISVSFARAFSQDNPNVQLTRRFYYDNDATACQNRTTGVSSVTTTGFKCHDNGWPASGGSVGVWYACGY